VSGGALFDSDPGLPKTVKTKWKHSFDAGLSGIDVERTDLQFGGLFDNDLGYSVRVRRSV